MVNGVSQVQVQGQQKYAVRVQVDPDKLVAKQNRAERGGRGHRQLESESPDGHVVRPDADLHRDHQRGS